VTPKHSSGPPVTFGKVRELQAESPHGGPAPTMPLDTTLIHRGR